jgi:predicted Zn-dependent protease
MTKFKIKPSILATLLLSLFIWSCSQIPITGRRQFKLLPESTLMEMSLTSYKQVLDTANVVYNTADAAMVKRVGNRIAAAVEEYLKGTKYENRIAGFNWEFNLINDESVNAWCMSGGKVAFYTGIIPVCEGEEGVAVVMGHEIAHAIAQHGNERVSQGLALQGVGVALDVAMVEKPDATRQAVQLAYGIGSQVGVLLPFSRKHESESDEMGLMFMAMAGYNPQEAPKFWKRMNEIGGTRPPEFISTHPSPEKRQERLSELMPAAMEIYNKKKS